ncbi:MAG: ATP-dependent Clp protease ATP-binding subunit [Oscillospiraceae bacterium]|nr:ATP-dependent Clp protease ATP-binding subunit [Oscillospiraceae bacterium]
MLCSRCKKRTAVMFITKIEGNNTTNEGLCLVCAKELGVMPVDDIMKRFGVTEDDLEAFSEHLSAGSEPEEGGFEEGGTPTFPNLFGNLFKNTPAQQNNERQREKDNSGQNRQQRERDKRHKYLDTYCDNLTQKAREGKLDNIIGREKEVYRTIQILSRRQKNNPCLIGEAGVGKTAIAEGIAQHIVAGDVPSKLQNKQIYLLDLTALVAGTQFRGQFESRVKGLLNEVTEDGNVILFIDEVHNLTGAGDADGAMSAANILKPALSRGEIQVIGATTFSEYRKYIEKDQALERRFQPVTVEEPSLEDSIKIIKGIKGYYENFHGLRISDEICESIVRLSERYISDRFLPDKAIDLLDEAAACAALACTELAEYQKLTARADKLADLEAEEEGKNQPDYEKIANIRSESIKVNDRIQELLPAVNSLEVTNEDVAKVIELWTGIPASSVEKDEYKRIEGLGDAIRSHIIGQDEAVDKIVRAIKRTRVGLSDRIRPASFIFVGPTGVGKTELAKVLASELFDSVDPLIRIDMTEYMERHTVSRLIGSPPGYVGYDEAGQLTEKVRRRPYSVVLFDEIEKAHPDVMNILLQILDEGRVTDAQGRTVNFEHTVIIMTSNAGSNIKSTFAGFGATLEESTSDRSLNALRDFLRPEFLSRVDEIVVFKPLSDESMRKIAALMIDEMRQPLADKGIKLTYTEPALDLLARHADGGKYGARDLRNVIRRECEDRIAEILVENAESMPASIRITAKNDRIEIVTRKRALPAHASVSED